MAGRRLGRAPSFSPSPIHLDVSEEAEMLKQHEGRGGGGAAKDIQLFFDNTSGYMMRPRPSPTRIPTPSHT